MGEDAAFLLPITRSFLMFAETDAKRPMLARINKLLSDTFL